MADFWDKTKDTIEDIFNEIIKGGAQGVEGIRTGVLTGVGFVGGLFNEEFKSNMQTKITQESDIDRFVAMIEGKNNSPFGFTPAATNDFERFIQNTTNEMLNVENSYINNMGVRGQRLTRGVAQGVGQMLPIIATGNIAGALGLSAKTASTLAKAQLFISAAGNASEEALNEGSTFDEATLYGGLSGSVEVLTEMLTGNVLPVFGKGGLDNAIAKVSTNKLWKVAVGTLGEGFEEALSEAISPYLQKIYKDDTNEWTQEHWQSIFESAIIGGLTSLTLGSAQGNVFNSSNEELLSDLSTLEEKSTRVYNRGLDNANIESAITKTTDKISQRLSKMSVEERTSYIKQNNLQNYFNEDGTVIARNNSQAISQAARQGNLPKNIKLSETINQEQRAIIQIANKMNKKVVFENNQNKDINAYYDPDTQTIVINSNAKNNDYRTHFVHELTHQLEGTKQYGAFVDYLISQASTNEKLQSILKAKGITAEKIAELYAKGKKSDDYVILTEFVSRTTSEVLFTDQAQIESLVTEHRNVAQKIYDWIKTQIKALRNPKTKEERAYLNMLKKAEELYSAALENEQGGVRLSDVENRQSIAEVDSEGNKLSDAQIEYFKDSKVRDKDGKLLVVYHGGGQLFNEFIDTGNIGFYFTEDSRAAKSYTSANIDSYDGIQFTIDEIETILNENGYTLEKIPYGEEEQISPYAPIEEEQVEKIRNTNYENANKIGYVIHDPNGKADYDTFNGEDLTRFFASSYENLVTEALLKKGYLNISNPLVLDAKESVWNEIEFEGQIVSTREIETIANERGYDGVIINNIYDTAEDWGATPMDVFVAFDSNQFKNVDNINPTKSKDIRYSLVGIKGLENAVSNGVDLFNVTYSNAIDQMNKAKSMRDEGLSNKEIKEKTGWYESKDGNWKFEISDKNIKVNKSLLSNIYGANGLAKLSQIIEGADDLFNMYPFLRDIDVVLTQDRTTALGGYDPRYNKLVLNLRTMFENVDSIPDQQRYDQLMQEQWYSLESALTEVIDNWESDDVESYINKINYPKLKKLVGNIYNLTHKQRLTDTIYDDFSMIVNGIVEYQFSTQFQGLDGVKGILDTVRERIQVFEDKYVQDAQRLRMNKNDLILSTVLHEMQHIIQTYENWSSGGNVKVLSLYTLLYDTMNKIENDPYYERFDKREKHQILRDTLNNMYLDWKVINVYANTLGEVEARRTGHRLNMTQEELDNDSDLSHENNVYISRANVKNLQGVLQKMAFYNFAYIMNDENFDYELKSDEFNDELDMYIQVSNNRYSVEGENNDLVALHNLNEAKFKKVLKLGGFPMPSIAITRANSEHNNFGNITVIFGRETIDPQSNYKNKVWSGDKYTPTVPDLEFEVNRDVWNKIYNYMLDNQDQFDRYLSSFSPSNIENYLDRHGEEEFRDYLLKNQLLMKYNQLVTKKNYTEFVDELIENGIKNKGIYNGADRYTASGNYRSFSATHMAETVENIVKIMVRNKNKDNLYSGVGEINSHTLKSYTSIDSIKKDAYRIVDEEKFAEDAKKHSDVLQELVIKIVDRMKFKDSNSFFNYDYANTYLGYIADAGVSEKNIKSVFDEFNVTYDEKLIIDVKDFFKGLENKLMRYFEAKPERAVSFKEIKNVLLPKSTSQSLIDELKSRNIPYTFYDETNTKDSIIQNMDNIRFSKDSEGNQLTTEQQEFFKDSQVRDENGNLQVVYHGTNDMFNVFDKNMQNKNEPSGDYVGQGFYFANDQRKAKRYGKNIVEAYLNLKNPLIINDKSDIDKLYSMFKDMVEIEEDLRDLAATENGIFEYMMLKEDNPAKIQKELIKRGYDGLIDNLYNQYAAFYPNQIKLTSNENPTNSEDIRYSQNQELAAKEKAKYTKEKVFNKKDAETVINDILDEYMVFQNYDGKLTNKTKDQVVRALWKELNSVTKDGRGKVALNIANYIIEHGIAEEAYQSNLVDYEFLDASKYFMRKLDLDSMKAEIQHAFGNDKSIYGVFGKRRGVKSTTVENMIAELESRGITIEGNSVEDQLINFYKRYKQAKSNIKKSIKSLKSVLSRDEMTDLKNGIVRTVLNAFDEHGKLTPYHGQLLKIQDLKSQLKDARVYSTALSKMMNSVDRVSGLEKYSSVESIPLSQEIVGLVKLLKKIKTWRGNLATAGSIRTIMSKYASKVENSEGKLVPLYDLYSGVGITDRNDFGEMVEAIAAGEGVLSVDEIRQIDLILTNFVHNVKNFDKVFFEGKVQERSVIARDISMEMGRVTPLSDGGMKELLGNYVRWVQSPIWRFDRLANYHEDGFFPRFYQELLGGVSKQVEFKRDVSQLYEDFFKTHKKVAKSWREQTFDINGIKLSKGQMISLYMLSFREQAQTHLFNIEENKGLVRISDEVSAKKFKYKEAITGGKDLEITPDLIKQIESQLTSVDKDYIKLTKKFFNVLSKNAKTETDVALYGVTNVVDGEYFPIRVSDDVLYKQIGDNGFGFGNMFSVYSASFNKDVKRNAKNKVVIENVLDVVERHAQQMSSYYGLAIPIKSFNQIWNTQVDDNTKVSSVVSNIDKSFERYVSDLFKAMQGIHAQKTTFDRVMGKIRGNWAKAALGFNPKVVATQFASLLASHGGGIEYGSLVKGIYKATTGKTDYENLYKYSPLMWDRAQEGFNVDLGLLKEQKGLLGNLDKLTELSTSLIGKTDNFVIGAIWNAALEQTKSQHKLHSNEHYQAAAKLVESVTFRTQANWTAIARPSILQTDNALLQTFTMFMSEPLQIFSQIAGNIDRVRIARKELKSATNDTQRKAAEKRIKVASKQARQYSVAMVSGAVYLSIVGMVFKWIKFGFDDEEEAMQTAYEEAIGYFIGTMPFIRDIYSLSQGYELSNMYETGLSNMWKGGNALWDMMSGIFEADYTSKNFLKDSRTLILGISQTLGVPLKNLETYIKGIIEKVDEDITYRYESNFYTQSYSSDLQAAIESNNDRLADTITSLMLKDKNIGITNESVKTETSRLTKIGYSVMPKAMMTSITVDGNTIELTNTQYKSFQSTYSQSESKIAKMIKTSGYTSLSDEAKSKAVKLTYDYYYNLAKEDLTGEDYNGNLGIAAKVVSIDKLALAVSYARTTSGSTKKSQIITFMMRQGLTMQQRNVILAYLGYAVDDSTTSYLKSLGLSNLEIEEFLA